MPKRLDRYAKAKERALAMRDYISREVRQDRHTQLLCHELHHCASWLTFNHYVELGTVRLSRIRSCRKHLVCPFCAIRRGARMMAAYLKRLAIVREKEPALLSYMVTFTVKNGPDLAERYQHLQRSVKALNKRRHGKHDELPREIGKVAGAVWSFEFKRGSNSGQWHPHMHGIWLCTSALDVAKLSAEWRAITGDSFIIDAHPMYGEPVAAFAEVFKYALKFSDLPFADNWEGFRALSGKRLVRSSGVLWGVEVPDDARDDLIEGAPYVELFFRHFRGAGYKAISSPRGLSQGEQLAA